MGWIVIGMILTGGGAVSLILMARENKVENNTLLVCVALVAAAGVVLLQTSAGPLAEAHAMVNQYQEQKTYFESFHADSLMVTPHMREVQKIQNAWLARAKAEREIQGWFSFYPRSIEDLEPISFKRWESETT